jgi:hypothetical protein
MDKLSAAQRARIEVNRREAERRKRSSRAGDLEVLSEELLHHVISYLPPISQRVRLRVNRYTARFLADVVPRGSLEYLGPDSSRQAVVMVDHVLGMLHVRIMGQRFHKLLAAIKSLPHHCREYDMQTKMWTVPLCKLELLDRKLGNQDLSCNLIERLLLQERVLVEREREEQAMCDAVRHRHRMGEQLEAALGEQSSVLLAAVCAAVEAGVRESLLSVARAELGRRAAAELRVQLSEAHTMTSASGSEQLRRQRGRLQGARAYARVSGVLEHQSEDGPSDAQNLSVAAEEAEEELCAKIIEAERDEAFADLGLAIAAARESKETAALAAAITRADDVLLPVAQNSAPGSPSSSLPSYETVEAEARSSLLSAARVLLAELQEEARKEEERRAREQEAEVEQRAQRRAKAEGLCKCNRKHELGSLGYHVCRYFGEYRCNCGSRWSSGRTFVNLGEPIAQQCRRCTEYTIAWSTRLLEDKRSTFDDESGGHRDDLCAMCQRLKRKFGPHACCSDLY